MEKLTLPVYGRIVSTESIAANEYKREVMFGYNGI
jgi:hypothetical protein